MAGMAFSLAVGAFVLSIHCIYQIKELSERLEEVEKTKNGGKLKG